MRGDAQTSGSSAGTSTRNALKRQARLEEGIQRDFEAEKAALLKKKQVELDQVFQRHDDLVRERFHMDHYTMMLTFHPGVAKEDHSKVFEDYKAGFDLLEVTEPVAGPSRQTRRTLTERKKIIQTASAPTGPISSAPVKSRNARPHPDSQVLNKEILDILNEAKEVREVEARTALYPEDLGASKIRVKKRKSTTAQPLSKRRPTIGSPKSVPATFPDILEVGERSDHDARLPAPGGGSVTLGDAQSKPRIKIKGRKHSTAQPLSKRKAVLQPSTLEQPPRIQDESVSFMVRRKKRRFSDVVDDAPHVNAEGEKKKKARRKASVIVVEPEPTDGAHDTVSIPISRPMQSQRPFPPTKQLGGGPHILLSSCSPLTPIPSDLPLPSPPAPLNPHIKRVKLTVRPPRGTYTHPFQLPWQPPAFGGSLADLLNSYRTLKIKGKEVPQESWGRKAEKEAKIRLREYAFRQQERFIPRTDVFFGTKVDLVNLPSAYHPPERTTSDHWDTIIEAVEANGKGKPKVPLGVYVAGQVASRVKAYWDAKEAKTEAQKEKQRLQEEKRLKALAKSTIKLVVGEWKKAVFHIREQQRLKDEAEERKRGRAHLDAILDQSGQLLSTQQLDLSRVNRSSSRGSSADAFLDLDQDSDDESDVETDVSEDEGDHDVYEDDIPLDESPTSELGESEDDGTDMLLMDLPHKPPEVGRPQNTPNSDIDSEFTLEALLYPEPESSPLQTTAGDGLDAGIAQDSGEPLLDAEPSTTSSLPLPNKPNRNATPDSELVERSPTGMDVDIPQQTVSHTGTLDDSDIPEVASFNPPEDDVTEETTELDKVDAVDRANERRIPAYLKPYAVAPVDWDPSSTIKPPSLLRGVLRPYQQSGLEWLASLHTNNVNGILADEMGLGKTIQTIALLAHLACDRGIWGPHLVVVPTSVILNWEMEFKKFLPGFKVVSYHGSPARRKELRKGWYDPHQFNVCITSYTLASRDQMLFKRKAWYYMILDEAHMIKNFKSQRWNTLLMFRSFRRLLLTGTPLQNNLTELWALLQFLMSGTDFANLKEFGDWFANPVEKAIEMGVALDEETMQRVSKLHTVLRPYLLRRLKRDVEKELPSKFEHLVLCPLSKRQRFLYDEFMDRAQTQNDLRSGVYQKIANILMQLRKVCNHPDLFEVRPIVTSFAMSRSAVADFEIKELLIRKRWTEDFEEQVNLDVIGLQFTHRQGVSRVAALARGRLDATADLPFYRQHPGDQPPKDFRTIAGFREYSKYLQRAQAIARWSHVAYLNRLRCLETPLCGLGEEALSFLRFREPLGLANGPERYPLSEDLVQPWSHREATLVDVIDRFAFVTPAVVARDMPRLALGEHTELIESQPIDFDSVLHRTSVKLQIAFPDPSLLQYDCGKLQRLAELLQEKKAGGHRVLIFTQMTRILDVLEIFLSFHGYLYLRLDGATKIEDRQYITERFNADPRVFCFIASSRSGGVGINLTGADTVIFYDSDFNPQMDRQCEDRAHRIGQIRDVHIYRLVSQYTVEEAMLRKANQKRHLDDIIIQQGEFDWGAVLDKGAPAITKALGDLDEADDARAAAIAANEADELEGADEADFEVSMRGAPGEIVDGDRRSAAAEEGEEDDEEEEEEGGTTVDYMVAFVEQDYDFFRPWRI